jgi:uncharacterized small protein (DUF1192 family)
MDWDDLQPKKPKSVVVGEDLRHLGLAELKERVAALQAEIARVETEIAAKKAIEAAAAAIFKKD